MNSVRAAISTGVSKLVISAAFEPGGWRSSAHQHQQQACMPSSMSKYELPAYPPDHRRRSSAAAAACRFICRHTAMLMAPGSPWSRCPKSCASR